jgi:hypothetical protein
MRPGLTLHFPTPLSVSNQLLNYCFNLTSPHLLWPGTKLRYQELATVGYESTRRAEPFFTGNDEEDAFQCANPAQEAGKFHHDHGLINRKNWPPFVVGTISWYWLLIRFAMLVTGFQVATGVGFSVDSSL